MLKKIGLILVLVIGVSLVLGSWQYQVQINRMKEAQGSFGLGNYQQALKVLEEVEDSFFIRTIERLPESWRPGFYWKLHYNKGMASFGLEVKIASESPKEGMATVAEEAFFQAKNCPDLEADTLYHLGLNALVRGDIDQAIQYWKEVLKVDENHFQAKYNLEWALRPREGKPKEGQGKGQKTEEILKKATGELNGSGQGGGSDQGIKK